MCYECYDIETWYRKEIDEMPGSKLNITFVLQLWNLHNTLDVIQTYGPMADWFLIEPLQDPKFMSWHMAPHEIYKDTIYYLFKLLQNKDDPQDELYKRFAQIIKSKQPHDPYLWTQLKQFTTAQDGLRKIKVDDYIKILAPYLR